MQPSNLLYKALTFDWRALEANQEIRVTCEGELVRESSQTLSANPQNYANRSKTLNILSLVNKLLNAEPMESAVLETENYKKAKQIYEKMRERIRADNPDLSPRQHPTLITEFNEMVNGVKIKLHERRSPPEQKDAVVHRSSDIPLAPTIKNSAAVKPTITPVEQEWLDWFAPKMSCLNAILELMEAFKKKEDTLKQGTNKDDTLQTLLIQRESIKKNLSIRFSELIPLIFDFVTTAEECSKLRRHLDLFIKSNGVDHMIFAQQLISCMTDKQIHLMLHDAIVIDITETVTHPEIFRNTATFCGALAGALFLRIAPQSMLKIVDRYIEQIQRENIILDKVEPIAKSLFIDLSKEFNTCQFSSEIMALFAIANTKINEKWKIPGVHAILGTLFLRGIGSYILERGVYKPHQPQLVRLVKFMQCAVNEPVSEILAMEKYLGLLLKKHEQRLP